MGADQRADRACTKVRLGRTAEKLETTGCCPKGTPGNGFSTGNKETTETTETEETAGLWWE